MDPAAMSQLGISWNDVWLTVVTAAGVYLSMIAFSRLFGARQFSTSSGYDLAFIFGLGSLIGRVVLVRISLPVAIVGIFTLFVLHAGIGWLHHNIPFVHRAVQNRPILLLADGTIIEANLRRAHVTRLELHQQLRLHGKGSVDGVRLVILERNGEFSVIGDSEPLDKGIFDELHGLELI